MIYHRRNDRKKHYLSTFPILVWFSGDVSNTIISQDSCTQNEEVER